VAEVWDWVVALVVAGAFYGPPLAAMFVLPKLDLGKLYVHILYGVQMVWLLGIGITLYALGQGRDALAMWIAVMLLAAAGYILEMRRALSAANHRRRKAAYARAWEGQWEEGP
jgi:ABC-type amino acid transport system permease subunit